MRRMRKKTRTKGERVKRNPGLESINKNKPKLEQPAETNHIYTHTHTHIKADV
jgi:hypothetical protein